MKLLYLIFLLVILLDGLVTKILSQLVLDYSAGNCSKIIR